MVQQTEQLLCDLKLIGIQETFGERLKQSQKSELGYEEFLNLILEDEKRHRQNEKIKRLLKRATFKQQASLEAFETMPSRGVDKKLLSDLSILRFIQNGQNILISGPTGVGKSFLASAIGHHACKNGFVVNYFRMNTLIEKFILERAKANYLNFIKKTVTSSILILDDFGIKPLGPQQYQDLYDVIDERGEEKSLIITTQVPPENWSEIIDDPVTCEAITDRVLSNCIKIKMKGESFRQKRGSTTRKVDKV